MYWTNVIGRIRENGVERGETENSSACHLRSMPLISNCSGTHYAQLRKKPISQSMCGYDLGPLACSSQFPADKSLRGTTVSVSLSTLHRVSTRNPAQPWESGGSLTPLGCARCWEGDGKMRDVVRWTLKVTWDQTIIKYWTETFPVRCELGTFWGTCEQGGHFFSIKS